MEDYMRLADIIRESDNIVFFGGAGVSTESDIPDFRGNGGLFRVDTGEEVRPETILHHDYFVRHPERFFDYYRQNMLYPDARPNPAHYALAELEAMGKVRAVITQNIDGLHQKAGSQNVIELHGSSLRNYCMECGKTYDLPDFLALTDSVPRCPVCGGIVRPDVVMYGEPLDNHALSRAEEAIAAADVLIVGGTSLLVHPAAGLMFDYQGDHMIIINRSRTPYDDWAELLIRDPIGETFERVMEEL